MHVGRKTLANLNCSIQKICHVLKQSGTDADTAKISHFQMHRWCGFAEVLSRRYVAQLLLNFNIYHCVQSFPCVAWTQSPLCVYFTSLQSRWLREKFETLSSSCWSDLTVLCTWTKHLWKRLFCFPQQFVSMVMWLLQSRVLLWKQLGNNFLNYVIINRLNYCKLYIVTIGY